MKPHIIDISDMDELNPIRYLLAADSASKKKLYAIIELSPKDIRFEIEGPDTQDNLFSLKEAIRVYNSL